MIDYNSLVRERSIRLARNNFWEFCKLLNPSFYWEEGGYLNILCNILQDLYERKLINPNTSQPYRNLITSLPRRWGKSYTYQMWEAWILGQNPKEIFITISYNTDLATDFSTSVRNLIMQEQSEDLSKICYSDIFKNTKLKQGSKSILKWRLKDSPRNNYLGTGLNATLTGKGASVLLIDDLIRNAKEAYNDEMLEEHYKFWTGSVLQVVENNGLKVVNFTRWRNEDLIGKILNGPTKDDWYVYTLEACVDGVMQCPPNILTHEDYLNLEKEMDPLIFRANYHQETVDIEGKLYNIKTYYQLPTEIAFEKRLCFVDVADTGSDYLCAIVVGIIKQQAFILDVMHTQDVTEITEPQLVQMLDENGVDECIVESNNAGRLFSRNIKRLLEDKNIYNIYVNTFTQSSNKETRILVAASTINKSIFFPQMWHNWRSFYREVNGFQKNAKNRHDDAADTLSLIAEYISKDTEYKFYNL